MIGVLPPDPIMPVEPIVSVPDVTFVAPLEVFVPLSVTLVVPAVSLTVRAPDEPLIAPPMRILPAPDDAFDPRVRVLLPRATGPEIVSVPALFTRKFMLALSDTVTLAPIVSCCCYLRRRAGFPRWCCRASRRRLGSSALQPKQRRWSSSRLRCRPCPKFPGSSAPR